MPCEKAIMAQHFLLSAAARTLSLKAIYSELRTRLIDGSAAYGGQRRRVRPCPVCGSLDIYDLTTCPSLKCAACQTVLSSRLVSLLDTPSIIRISRSTRSKSDRLATEMLATKSQFPFVV